MRHRHKHHHHEAPQAGLQKGARQGRVVKAQRQQQTRQTAQPEHPGQCNQARMNLIGHPAAPQQGAKPPQIHAHAQPSQRRAAKGQRRGGLRPHQPAQPAQRLQQQARGDLLRRRARQAQPLRPGGVQKPYEKQWHKAKGHERAVHQAGVKILRQAEPAGQPPNARQLHLGPPQTGANQQQTGQRESQSVRCPQQRAPVPTRRQGGWVSMGGHGGSLDRINLQVVTVPAAERLHHPLKGGPSAPRG